MESPTHSADKKIKVGIIGGTGYTGGELLRLLTNHPNVTIEAVTSRKSAGVRIDTIHKHLKGFYNQAFETPDLGAIAKRCDIVFTAVPHGAAMNDVPQLLKDTLVKVVDLSADYRLPASVFEKTYALKHTDPRDVVYGLVELHPEAASETLVANPGCYPTGSNLAAAPLAAKGLIDHAIFDSKSGVSGAGIKPSDVSHYPNLAQNIEAYKLTTHRHAAEIRQELGRLQGDIGSISFTPHVIPAIRGILTTAHIFTKEKMDTDAVQAIYTEFYAPHPFVRVIDSIPMLGAVRGTNFCDIFVEVDESSNRIVVVSAIDNLVKGASGQAIQNMNLMFNLPQTTGLWTPAVNP